MEGWAEEEIRNRNLMAPCGLYCGSCGIYIATRDGNQKSHSQMAGESSHAWRRKRQSGMGPGRM